VGARGLARARGTKTAHARTRGVAVTVYGDFEFCVVEMVA
jgi:hypothetical protein